MKQPHYIAILAFVAVMFGIATTHETHSSGSAPTQLTNAPGEGNCTSCHSGTPLNGGSGSVSISGLPTGGYVGGQTYAVTVTVNNTQTSASKRSGFSATALNSTNAKAGTLAVINSTTTAVNTAGGRQYVGHKSASTSVSSWTFNWTAPAAGTGTVTFYAVGNAANGSGSGGDQIYSTQASVSEAVAAPVATLSVNQTTICAGSSIIATGTATNSPSSVSYDFGNGQTKTTVGPHTVVYTQPGNYTITFSATNGGGTDTDTKNITVLPAPQVSIAGFTQVCQGANTQLTATAANIASYVWNTGATTGSINAGVGCYTAEVTDINGCKATSAQVCVTAFTKSAAPVVTPASPAICQGDSVQLTAAAGYSNYVWSSGEFGTVLFVNTAGTYSVSAIDGNGCATDTANVTLVVNPLPQPAIVGPSTFCAGSSAQLSVSPSGFASYLWSDGSTNATLSTTQSGSFTVKVTDANGCSGMSPVFATTAGASLKPVISPAGTINLCDGDSLIISAGQYTSYLWSNAATSQSIKVKGSAKVSVTVTDANGCSGTSDTTNVVLQAKPVPTISFNGSPNMILNATPGYVAYQWYVVNTVNAQNFPTDVSPIAGANADSVVGISGIMMAVEVTDANGCKGFSQAFILIVESADELAWARAIQLAPNPAREQLMLSFGAEAPRSAAIYIQDVQGKTLLATTTQGETQLPIAIDGLASGIYLARIVVDGQSITRKFVKQ